MRNVTPEPQKLTDDIGRAAQRFAALRSVLTPEAIRGDRYWLVESGNQESFDEAADWLVDWRLRPWARRGLPPVINPEREAAFYVMARSLAEREKPVNGIVFDMNGIHAREVPGIWRVVFERRTANFYADLERAALRKALS